MSTSTEVLPEVVHTIINAGRLAPTEYERAVADALADSDAAVVGQCVCDKCDKVIATVTRTRSGLLFRSAVTAFDVWPQLPERYRQALNRQPIMYTVATLLDHHEAAENDRPRAGCPKHGERRVDAAELLAKVRAVRLGKKLRVVLSLRDSAL